MDSINLQNGSSLLEEETSWRNEFLQSNLQTAILNITFIKKDGTQRLMRCTLRADLLPAQTDLEESIQKKAPNPEVLAVWDLENVGWRSFRYDSIIGFAIDV